jgi:hypothetical protein
LETTTRNDAVKVEILTDHLYLLSTC